jgi:hypothetical protein
MTHRVIQWATGSLPGLYRSLYSETLRFMADNLGFANYALEPDHHVELAPVTSRSAPA